MGKDFRKPIRFVIFPAGRFERMNQAAGHGHHGQTARHDQNDGDGLAGHATEIAPKFAVEVREHG